MTVSLDSKEAHLPYSSEPLARKIHVRRLEVFSDREFRHAGSDLRRAITAAFPDNDSLHNHLDSGKYRIPPIRFCVLDKRPNLVAINDGIDTLEEVYTGLNEFWVHDQSYRTIGKELYDTFETIGMSSERKLYRTVRPWVALNADNFAAYENAGSEHDREAVLKRVLIGNMLSLAKSVGYHVPSTIEATIIRSRRSRLVHKGTKMVGFRVLFSTNMDLPMWLGIGKLVSKGFGLLRQVE